MNQMWKCVCAAGGVLGAAAQPACSQPASAPPAGAVDRRDVRLADAGGRWGGEGVCYGPFRDGQRPGGESPTPEQILEDLKLMSGHWSMLRMYGSRGATEHVCRLIREHRTPMKVMVGAWIDQESKRGGAGQPPTPTDERIAAENRAEVATAVALANEYPDVVIAINIGNEALVDWSSHRVPASVIIGYLREARRSTRVPVTTCDTDLYWTSPESVEVAKECDFLALHAYAMWNKQVLRDALGWTRGRIDAVRAMHPDMPVVITEIGWATQKGTQGDQARLIVAEPGEADQELFYRAFRDWAVENRQAYFYFSAFDENWKGGDEPSEVEKHWGVFRADRTPKKALQKWPAPEGGSK
jgi:exo-beta-1,3-glucanase (GH17 family)